MQLLPTRLGPKLNLSIIIFLVLLAAATSAVVFVRFNQTQRNATESSRAGLEEQGTATLLSLARLVSDQGQLMLDDAAAIGAYSAGNMTAAARTGSTTFDAARLRQDGAGVTFDPDAARITDVWVAPGQPIDAAVERDLRDSAALDALFPSLLARYPDAVAIYFLSPHDAVRMYPADSPSGGRDASYRPTNDRVFINASPDRNRERRTIWAPPYASPSGAGQLITASTPVYDGDEFRGVIGVDLSLDRLNAITDEVRPTPNGFAFVIGRDGLLLRGAAHDTVQAAIDSGDERIRDTAAAMYRGDTGASRLELGGRDVVVAYAPLGDIGGSIALVAPVEELTSSAQQVEDAIDRDGNRTIAFILLAMLVLFGIALAGTAYLTQRFLLRPIGSLVAGTRAVASGNLAAKIPVTSSDELGVLAESFNAMTQELASSRARLDDQQAQLQSSEAELRALFAAMRDSVLVVDRSGLVLRAAPSGVTADPGVPNLIGLRMHDLLPAPQADALRATIDRALDQQETMELEYGHPVRAGGPVIWFSAVVSPMSDDRVLWVARDITARKRMESDLRERQEQYRAIFDAASDGIFITDLSDNVIDANPAACAMHGYTLEELRAMPPFAMIDPRYRERGTAAYLAALRSGNVFRGRSVNVRKDGTPVPIDVYATPIVYAGKPAILAFVRDITEQLNAEAVLERRVDERTRELRTVLEVARTVSSTITLQPLLKLVLEQVAEVAPYDRAGFMLIEDGEIVVSAVAAFDGVPEEDLSRQVGTRHDAAQFGMWRDIAEGRAIIIDDIHGDAPEATAYRSAAGPLLETAFAEVHSWLGVPVMLQDQAVGMLALAKGDAAYFNAHHADLAMAISSQAAVAIENARLFERVEERTRELSALLEVSHAVSSTIELGPLLRLVLDQARSVIDYNGANVLFFDESGGRMDVMEFTRGDASPQPGLSLTRDALGPVWDAVLRREPATIWDVRSDEESAQMFRRAVGPALETAFAHVRAWAAIPLVLPDHVIGMLAFSHAQPGFFKPEKTRLLRAVADQAAAAIENARLFERLASRTGELTALLEVSQSVASTLELRQLVRLILEQLRSVTAYRGASILLLEDDALRMLEFDRADAEQRAATQRGARFTREQMGDVWAAMLRRESTTIQDIRDDSPVARQFRRAVGPMLDTVFANTHSWAGVPLVTGDRVIGMLAISHGEPAYFTPQRMAVIQAVADQAAAAVENARLFERLENRTRELTALLEISRNVAAATEVRPAVRTILEELRTIVDYNSASIVQLEDGVLHTVDVIRPGLPEEDPSNRTVIPIADAAPLWQQLTRGRPAIVPDVRADTPDGRAYRTFVGEERLHTTLKHVRAWVAVPMMAQDRVFGALIVSHATPGYFTRDLVGVLSAVANGAAIAIEHARLFESLEDRTRELAALLEISGRVSSTLELRKLVRFVLEQIHTVVPYSSAALLTLEDARLIMLDALQWPEHAEDGAAPTEPFTLPPQPDQLRAIPIAAAGMLWDALHNGRAIAIDDVWDDTPASLAYRRLVGGEQLRTNLAHITSWLAVPLIARERTFGTIILTHRERAFFTPEIVQVAQSVASQAGVAMENARLYGVAQEAAANEERQRLARELHDSVSQALYGIALGARTARTLLDRDASRAKEPVDYVLSLAEAGLAEMRALIFELRPESIELEGLRAAIEKQAAALRARHNIDVEEDLCPEPDVPLPVKEAAARIAQEAMHNTVKHARATHVRVALACDDGALTLRIEDNGAGFDPTGTFAGHLGLRSMRERVAKLGGTIDIDSAPGAGARITVRIPVAPA